MMQGAAVSLGGLLVDDAILTRVVIEQRLNAHSFCELRCPQHHGPAHSGRNRTGRTVHGEHHG